MEDYQFSNLISEIESKSGNGTELISLYIPKSKKIHEVTNKLRDELGQCSNIKSKQTRVNVQSAISSILSRLNYIEVPDNGIVIFCGEVNVDHKQEFYCEIMEPPHPITTYSYTCDCKFKVDILKDMLIDKAVYGLLVVDLKEATWGFLRGTKIEVTGSTTSLVPGKHNKGGQSSKRFERLRDIAINDFNKKLGEMASEGLMSEPNFFKRFQGLILGGPGNTKLDFEKGSYLHHELQRRIIGTIDTSYTNDYGLKELVDASQSLLKDHVIFKEKSIMSDFLKNLLSNKSIYGEFQVNQSMIEGKVDLLILSEKYKNLNEVITLAKSLNIKYSVISIDFDEGSQLLYTFGGIAAILRYR